MLTTTRRPVGLRFELLDLEPSLPLSVTWQRVGSAGAGVEGLPLVASEFYVLTPEGCGRTRYPRNRGNVSNRMASGPEVSGLLSSTVGMFHGISFSPHADIFHIRLVAIRVNGYRLATRVVAQLGSAPALGAGGRGFKSHQPDNVDSDRLMDGPVGVGMSPESMTDAGPSLHVRRAMFRVPPTSRPVCWSRSGLGGSRHSPVGHGLPPVVRLDRGAVAMRVGASR